MRAGLVEQRIERGVEQAVDQRGRRVVGAGLLALVAGQLLQCVGELLGVVVRDQLKQRFVHAAEFLGAEVTEVHAPPCAALARLDQGQRTYRAEQCLVGQARAGERLVERERAAVVALVLEDSADAGQRQLGQAALGAQRAEDELRGVEEVAVPAAAVPPGELAQPGGGEVRAVPVAGRAQPGLRLDVGVVGIWLEQGAPVFGDKPEQHPVDEPQQRPVEVLELEVGVAGVEPDPQLRVRRVGQESGAENGNGLLDAVA